MIEAFPLVEGMLYYVEEEGEDAPRTRFVHAIDGLTDLDVEKLRTNRHEDILFPLHDVFVEEGVLYQVFHRLEGTLLAHSIEVRPPSPR